MSDSRPVRSAAIATAVAVSILLGLGVWQLQRLAWKEGVLAQIAAAERAAPVALGVGVPPLFTRVTVAGVLQAAPVALYGAEVRDGKMGAQLIELLARPGLAALVVDLGWVPVGKGPVAGVSGPVTLAGYIRLPERAGWLSAPDDSEGRHFYSLNPSVLGAALGQAEVAPFTLVAMGPALVAGGPQPAVALPQPVNNHLNYALTWFGLAASCLGIFVAWVVRGRGS